MSAPTAGYFTTDGEPPAMRAELAARFDQLPEADLDLFSPKKVRKDTNVRLLTDRCTMALYRAGFTLDEATEIAPSFPNSFGLVNSYAETAIRETWIYADQLAAEREAERAELKALAASLFDPWADPVPPAWPGGVLSREIEDTIAALSLNSGIDFGALALAYLTAASGAAPKDARFMPYQHTRWVVPPIIWLMLLADSGQRKTSILDIAFGALKRRNKTVWAEHSRAMKEWRGLSDDARKAATKPVEPHAFIVGDVTPEKLQLILAENSRGSLLLRDELASLFDFGRYTAGKGASERAFYLEAYEGGSYTAHRMSRDAVHIENAGLTIYGGIQPDRLAAFKDLESDGLLQRFIVMQPEAAKMSRPDVAVPNLDKLDHAIDRLMQLDGRMYGATRNGGDKIRATEYLGGDIATISDYGKGFQGFARKLHGTHARMALILHMLETPEAELVADATIERAGRLVREFMLPHARRFYAAIPTVGLDRMRNIAGWLLTKGESRVLTSDITSGVKACRGLPTKELAAALEPLITGGWLEPEEPFPSNRAWLFNTDVRRAFARQAETERVRRENIRALIGRIDKP